MTPYQLIHELMELCKNNSQLSLEETPLKMKDSPYSISDLEIGFSGYIDEHQNNKFQIIIKPKEDEKEKSNNQKESSNQKEDPGECFSCGS